MKAATVYQNLQAQGFDCKALPLCFDESVQSLRELQEMYATGAMTALNIKVGRLGGLRQAVQCIQFCRQNGIGFFGLVAWWKAVFPKCSTCNSRSP